ncbi:MAG: flagellar brake protein [Gammaproteobacteria bacterium]
MDNSNQKMGHEQLNNTVDDYGQFHVENPFEMCSILKSLIIKPDVITAYYDGKMEDFILTSVIAVDTKKRTFILDFSSDLKKNELLIQSNRITCKTKCKNVQVEFSLNKISAIKYNNEDAFCCELPSNILHLQRRDFYRMAIPLGDKLVCTVAASNGHNRKLLTLADISSGGVGLNETDLSNDFELFDTFRHCEIDLGEVGAITFDIELRNKRIIKTNNNDILRLGYKFIDLQTPENAKIQRYIHSVDMRKKQSK